jgi:putative ABC transport system permease protein
MLRVFYLVITRHLLQSPMRTAVTVIGVALGVSVSVAIRTANVEVLKSFQHSIASVAGTATLQVSAGEAGLDERVIQTVRRHPGVRTAMPVIQANARIAEGPHRGTPFLLVALDLIDLVQSGDLRVSTGETDSLSMEPLLTRAAVYIGHKLAAEWGVKVGDVLEIAIGAREYRLTVQGILDGGTGPRTVREDMGVMDIAAAQALFGLVGRLDRIDVETEPGWSVDKIAEELQAELPAPMTVHRPARRNQQVERMVQVFQFNLTMLSAVGLLVGLFLIYNAVAFSVVQRRREIGMFYALGLKRNAISCLFIGEAAAIGLVGGFCGSWLGAVFANNLVGLLSRTISDLYVPLVAGGADAGSFASWLHVPAAMLAHGCAVGTVVSMAGAVGPSLDASRTMPVRALSPGDYESTQVFRLRSFAWIGTSLLVTAGLLALPGPVAGLPLFGYAATLCLLIGLACLTPLAVRGLGACSDLLVGRLLPLVRRGRAAPLFKLAADQAARSPGRNSVTISAMMVGISIMVGVGTMIGSFRQTVETWIHQTIMADLIVAPNAWLQGEESGMLAKYLPGSWAGHLAAVPGVAAVDPYRESLVELRGRSAMLVSRDLRLHAERSRYWFLSGDSATTLERTVTQNGVIVSEVLARSSGIRTGQIVRLTTPAGEREFGVVGIFYDYATDGGKIVMDRSLYRRLWQDDTATVFAVYLKAGADGKAVRRSLIEAIGRLDPDRHPAIISNGELKREILAIFDRTFTVTYALELIAVVIAILGIVNTLIISVVERRRELATLRAVGASATQIEALMLWESAYLGLLGALLGMVGGILLSILLIEVINKQSFGWTIQLRLSAGLLLKAGGLAWLAAVAASYLPARWAAQQPVAEGLRYE